MKADKLKYSKEFGADDDLRLLTVPEVAELLRTSQKAIYAMAARRTIAGVVRIGKRLLFVRNDLVQWLGQKSVPSLERA